MQNHNNGGECMIPCFDCMYPGFPHTWDATWEEDTLHAPLGRWASERATLQLGFLGKGQHCRNALRHAACAFNDDPRYAIIHGGGDGGAECDDRVQKQPKTFHTKRQQPETQTSSPKRTIPSPDSASEDMGENMFTDGDHMDDRPYVSPLRGSSLQSPDRTGDLVANAGQERSQQYDNDMLVTRTVSFLQTIFQDQLPGHIPVKEEETSLHTGNNNLFFVIPTVCAQRGHGSVDEFSFNLDTRRPVYLQLLTRDPSQTLEFVKEVYFVCSAHTVPGIGLPQQIPGLQTVIHDPECMKPCTCWRAFLLYCSAVMRTPIANDASSFVMIASTLQAKILPWVLRPPKPGDVQEDTITHHRVWEPSSPQHAFNVFMVSILWIPVI